ncbi:dienelactone hydrolase family protein [Olivibacter sp. SDN3]|uniref:alpha/beta hydrolase n=1 Tax=Olivibacter sp. SDN3 TaxID=2764720 RepID=UPI0016516D51|nr:prolyl oligopeptidase family serine peptidase [Olivibacter sp. SDN3]QNL50617.1 dienelactone hydrolase family protein [Olivibacter sp. SDN3]
MYTHQKQFIKAGKPFTETDKALLLIHGRGGRAQDIISLQQYLKIAGMALYAPQATNNSWYPYSFMAPEASNQPALNSALELIHTAVADLTENGIATEKIYFLGFSQGACLTLEYVGRHAKKYGGVIAFTGGLIGEELVENRYTGDFQQTPLLITTGDPDPHVPVSRVKESVDILEQLGAQVTLEIYKGKTHSISPEEIALANSHVLK